MFVQKLGSRDNISGANHIPPLSGCASLTYGRGFHRQNTVYPHRTILFIHRLLQGKKKKDAYVCYPYRATLTVLFITRDQHHPSIQLESIFRTLPRLSSNASEAPLSLELAYFEHRMSEVYVYPCTTEKADENLQPHKTKMTDEE